MRKTKIICTIGPASENEETLEKLLNAGMNVARLNFSHGTHEEHQKKIDTLKRVREKLKKPLGIMLDTKGPECRIKTFENGVINLKKGDPFTFTTRDIIGNESIVSVAYEGLNEDVAVGDTILLNNGLSSFVVDEIDGQDIKCTTVVGGEIRNRKSMSFPGKVLRQAYLSDQDKEDLLFGIKNDVDFIACSFVSVAQDLIDVKNFLAENGNLKCELIAKIENQSGIDNIEEICRECDGIMIGRGDMGVEIPFEKLPAAQKKIITKCRMLGKRVITATEMLESMISNPRPTRAEISDVANAVYDGTSAIMLSGETAMGKYPVKTVETMAKIAEATEKSIHYKNRYYSSDFKIKNTADAISHATCALSIDVDAKAIVVYSTSGITARMVSRFRSPIDILGLTTEKKTWHRVSLSWGVTPALCEKCASTEEMTEHAKQIAKEVFKLKTGDKIIITCGAPGGKPGSTNQIRVEEI